MNAKQSTSDPSANPSDTLQYTFAQLPVLLTLQSYSVPVLVLLIPYIPLLSHYQYYWYNTVPVATLLICYGPILS